MIVPVCPPYSLDIVYDRYPMLHAVYLITLNRKAYVGHLAAVSAAGVP